MDTKFQTSFIPKKPLVPTGGRIKTSHHISFFSIIVILIFLIAVAGAGIVFARETYLNSRITKMSIELKAAQDALDTNEINEWVRLDKRIQSGKELLDTHLALSAFFDMLSAMTLKSVQFTNFSYAVTTGEKVAISMEGQADNFAAVALQSDEFAKNAKFITNQLFSNIDQNKEVGKISFRFTAIIDPALISYRKVVQADDSTGANDTVTLPAAAVDQATTTTRTLPRTGSSTGSSTPTQ